MSERRRAVARGIALAFLDGAWRFVPMAYRASEAVAALHGWSNGYSPTCNYSIDVL